MSQDCHRVIVIGASAGGVEALIKLVPSFPEDLPAAVFITLHIPANSAGALPKVLSNAARVPVAHPIDGESIQRGRIYVAPPDCNLLIADGSIHLSSDSKENDRRPAIDPMFRSAANFYGPRAIGVILTGTLGDGTSGLLAVKQGGGVAVVQDPGDALFSGMPESAIENVDIDYILPLTEIGPLLQRLTAESAAEVREE